MKDPVFAKEIEEVLVWNKEQPRRLLAWLDMKLVDCSKEENFAEFSFDSVEWGLNPYGGIHGGIICSLFDTSIGVGAVAYTQKNVSTTDITVSYLKPMTGPRYIFRAEYSQIGRRMARAIGKAIDPETGVVCATAMASFVMTDERPKGLRG